jgi:hypothetical protein
MNQGEQRVIAGLIAISTLVIAVSAILIKLMADLAERQFVRIIGSKLSDAEQIVNEGKLPEAWVQPYRERIEAIRDKDGSESKMQRVGRQARRRCLRNLDSMIKFFQERNVTDGEATRQFLLNSLKAQRDRVAAAAWQDILAPEAGAHDEAEPPAENQPPLL